MILRATQWLCFFLLLAAGCATSRTSNTDRTGLEQLLVSNAIDRALSKFDYSRLSGQAVFVDDQYLDCVDKGYLVGSIRHRVMSAGGRLVASADDASVVVEPRSGGVGTDDTESFVGMPGIALPGPMPVELPEIRLWNRKTQFGTAKVGLVAYDSNGNHLLGNSSQAIARSDDSKWFILGIGPFQEGTVPDEVRIATELEDADANERYAVYRRGNPATWQANPIDITASSRPDSFQQERTRSVDSFDDRAPNANQEVLQAQRSQPWTHSPY